MMMIHPLHIPSDWNERATRIERMNNPFDYEPHPLCLLACQELQAYLAKRKDWREEIDRGKMFGVLIVERKAETKPETEAKPVPHSTPRLGYLAAYSGQIGGRSDWDDFVPAVFDYLQPDGYFKTHEAEITHINQTIGRLESDPRMETAREQIALLQKTRKETIDNYQAQMKAAKAKRDARRLEMEQRYGDTSLSAEERQAIEKEEQAMIKESQFMKAELRRLKKSLGEKTTLESEYADYLENILRLKQLRKQLSDALQQWLFSQFRMLNPQGEQKNLLEIFKDFALGESSLSPNGTSTIGLHIRKSTALKLLPPAGSGECCEPKLLQYAYAHGLKPLQIAMFWWGESPKEEIRHHLHFYPACNGKCKPILRWMLPENNQQLDGPKEPSAIETLYEDDQIVVICKPAGMLSVPGKDTSAPSVFSMMRKKYPQATGPLIVHRLDMATSGLMVIAKTEFAYHQLQKQFANHEVRKKYVAIVGCKSSQAIQQAWEDQHSEENLTILSKSIQSKNIQSKNIQSKSIQSKSIQSRRNVLQLPLMPDFLDRPRQVVSHEHGKEAITEWEITKELGPTELPEKVAGDEAMHYFRLALYPQTGRTHQLRVHCAHQEGLNAPILGDPLYGNVKASRLYLHAEEITFRHPLTNKEIHIEKKADF